MWFNSSLGYGYIKPDCPVINEGKDLFVHFKYMVMRGFKSLVKDDVVEFYIGQNHKGPCAIDVKVDSYGSES